MDYWDVMGAEVGDEDGGDKSLDEIELGWYLADYAEASAHGPPIFARAACQNSPARMMAPL